MAKTIRVYKSDGVWVAKKDGASKASAVENTKKEAYQRAREIALNQGLTITVYYPNGGIETVINPKNQDEDDGNCFITTSCVKYYGLKDNCYELETLRKFRDQYLKNSEDGKKLIIQYYEIAPVLVKKLESSPNRELLFGDVFKLIRESCKAIDDQELEKAKEIYICAVRNLIDYFNKK